MNQTSVCLMVGHLQPLASESLRTTTGEMTGGLNVFHRGRSFGVKLGVQFESLKQRPLAMPDAMNYALGRMADMLQEWLNTASYSLTAYHAFAAQLVEELDTCFGPRHGVVFRGIALYGQETLPLLAGASGLWQAPRRGQAGWWW